MRTYEKGSHPFRKSLICMAVIFCTLLTLTGCSEKSKLDPKNPVTLTMWHNYGGNMQVTMDLLIDEFNATVGKEKGIVIDVTAISSSSDLNRSLAMIVNEDPGAPEMPDIFTGYPKIAIQFYEKDMLVNLEDYINKEKEAEYVDAFIEEGRIEDKGLYVFPVAKSTEILYLNRTLFDEFSKATGADIGKLSTFDGIAELSKAYYEWSGGKQFFTADSWFNVAEVGMVQLGSSLIGDKNELSLNNKEYEHIFNTLYSPSVTGGIAIYDGYSSDLSKTGDIVCSTGSSAGILFYGDTITYADGTVKQAQYEILPYPVFEDGSKQALQRGGGLMVTKSDEKKAEAAVTFLLWLTAPQQNMRFIESTGYLPVTKQAFEQDLQTHLKTMEDARIQKMLTAVLSMYQEYKFFTAPNFSGFDEMSSAYEKEYKNIMNEEIAAYQKGTEVSADTAFDRFMK